MGKELTGDVPGTGDRQGTGKGWTGDSQRPAGDGQGIGQIVHEYVLI